MKWSKDADRRIWHPGVCAASTVTESRARGMGRKNYSIAVEYAVQCAMQEFVIVQPRFPVLGKMSSFLGGFAFCAPARNLNTSSMTVHYHNMNRSYFEIE